MYYAIDVNIMIDYDIDELKEKLGISYGQIVVTESLTDALRRVLRDAIKALRSEERKSRLIIELLQKPPKLGIRETFRVLSDITSDDNVLNSLFRFFYAHFKNLRNFFRETLKIRNLRSKVHVISFVQNFTSSLCYTDSSLIANRLVNEMLRRYKEKGVKIIHSTSFGEIVRKYSSFCEKLEGDIDKEDCYQLLLLDLQDEVQDLCFVTGDRALRKNFDKYREEFRKSFGRQTKIREIIVLE